MNYRTYAYGTGRDRIAIVPIPALDGDGVKYFIITDDDRLGDGHATAQDALDSLIAGLALGAFPIDAGSYADLPHTLSDWFRL